MSKIVIFKQEGNNNTPSTRKLKVSFKSSNRVKSSGVTIPTHKDFITEYNIPYTFYKKYFTYDRVSKTYTTPLTYQDIEKFSFIRLTNINSAPYYNRQ